MSKWISIKDRYPGPRVIVEILHEDGTIAEGWRTSYPEWVLIKGKMSHSKITHWALLTKKETKMEWTRVEDQLPEADAEVLVMFGKNDPPCEGVMMGRRHCGACVDWTVTNSYGSTLASKEVTHWTPMPEPPKKARPFRTKRLDIGKYAVVHQWYGVVARFPMRESTDNVCRALNEIWRDG